MDPKLYKAVSSGDCNNFLSLINSDPSLLSQTTVQKNTALHVAATFNQREIAKEITRLWPGILYATNSEQDTALHLAARLGSFQVTEHLIEFTNWRRDDDLEADDQCTELMRMVNSKEDTALHDAVRNGHGKIAQLLVEKCPELAAKANKSGESSLFLAVENDYFDIAQEILKLESNCLSYGGRDGANVLHVFIIRTIKGYPRSVRPDQSVLSSVLNNFKDGMDRVRLLLTEEFVAYEIAKLSSTRKDFIVELLGKCPDIIRKADTHGWLPLHYAANLGSEEVADLILNKDPFMAYEKDKDGMSALHIAAKKGHVGVFKTIVKLCPDSCELLDNVKGRTVFHVAVENKNVSTVKTILTMQNFMNVVNQQDMDGNTALHRAAICGHIYLTMKLATCERVANNIINNQGLTTSDIIRLSPKFNFYTKPWALKLLAVRGAVQGMRQVLAREPISNYGLTNSDSEKQNLVEKEKVTDLETKEVAIAAKTTMEKNNKSGIGSEWLNANLVVSTIIATVTFSAAFQVPGGNSNNGMAVLWEHKYFKAYLVLDALSFGFAVASMFLTFLAQDFVPMKLVLQRKLMTLLTGCSLLLMSMAFIQGMTLVVEEKSDFSGWLTLLYSLSLGIPLYVICYPVIIQRGFGRI